MFAKTNIAISSPRNSINDFLDKSENQLTSQFETVSCEDTHTSIDNNSLSDFIKNKIKFICESCNFKTNDKSHFNRHNKSKKHLKNVTNQKLHKCTHEGCKYESYYTTNLKKHIVTHETRGNKFDRDKIFIKISGFKGKIKRIREHISNPKNEYIKNSLMENLNKCFLKHNKLSQKFNDIENTTITALKPKEVILDKDKEMTEEIEEIKIEELKPKTKSKDKITCKNKTKNTKSTKEDKARRELLRDIEELIKRITDQKLKPCDCWQITIPNSYDDYTNDELQKLIYDIEDLVTDRDLMTDLRQENNIIYDTDKHEYIKL